MLVDYLCVERYGLGGTRGGRPRLAMDAALPVAGTNVFSLDAIADRGQTLGFVRLLLESRRPAALRTCVLFEKEVPREVAVPIDYPGLRCRPFCNRLRFGLPGTLSQSSQPRRASRGSNGLTTT